MRLSFHDCNLTISFIQFLAGQRTKKLKSHKSWPKCTYEDTHLIHPDTWCQVFNPRPMLPPFTTMMCGNPTRVALQLPSNFQMLLDKIDGRNCFSGLLPWCQLTSMTVGPNFLTPCPLNGYIDEKEIQYSKSNLLGCSPVQQSWVPALPCTQSFLVLSMLCYCAPRYSSSCTLISVEHLSRAKRALGGTTSA